MAQVDEVALTRRAQRRLSLLRQATALALIRLWDGLPDHHEEAQPRWSALASPVVLAAQSRAIDTQIAYLRARLGEDITFDRAQLLALSTVDLSDPFISLAVSLRDGESLRAALKAGRERTQDLADTAVSHASRSANTAADGHRRIVGWRRVLTGDSCDWCVTVAGQRYRSAESAAFGHEACNCSVAPIIGTSDPGRVLNSTAIAPQ